MTEHSDLNESTWVTVLADRAVSLERRCFQLRVAKGPDAGKGKRFDSGTVRVGAQDTCDFVLNDSSVSGVHFEIELNDNGYRLRDLDSTNGTFVGETRILSAYVQPNVEIRAGKSHLVLEPLRDTVTVPLSESDQFGPLLGSSTAMRQLFVMLERLAATDMTVLVNGETGSGKELVAHALAEKGPRHEKPFVVVDCGAIPSNLIESELFGHKKGAFTGATDDYAGAFERAHGGTLFLDEVGELPLESQPKLLRALEDRTVRPVGGSKAHHVDVRIVAATNRDLEVEVSRGAFREDLYYRLAVAKIAVPPLRKRVSDIPLLVKHFLSDFPAGGEVDPETMERMKAHPWPGNIRELRNAVGRYVVLSEDPLLPVSTKASGGLDVDLSVPFRRAKAELVEAFESQYFEEMLAKHGGNVTRAAKEAGVDRMTVHKLINRRSLQVVRD